MGKLPLRELRKRHMSPSTIGRKAKAAAKAMEEKERNAKERDEKDKGSNR